MNDEFIGTNIEKKECNALAITTDTSSIQFSPETVEMISKVGASALKGMIDASTQKYMNAIQKELEVQVRAMEITVIGQKSVLDTHEKKQHDLLETYLMIKKILFEQISIADSLEEKTGLMKMLERENEELEQFYIENNKNLDSNLEHVKQRQRGKIRHFLHGLVLKGLNNRR